MAESPRARNVGAAQRIVSFNCGGTTFDTTLATLESAGENLLSKLATTEVGVLKDRKGRIFLDRNPKTFSLVLEFLRCGTIALLDEGDAAMRAAVDMELRFFCISGMPNVPNQQTSDVTIRHALARAHTLFVDSWLERYDETATRITAAAVADLQQLAASRKLISTKGRCSSLWYCSSDVATDPAFPVHFGPKQAPVPMKNNAAEWFSDFLKTFAASNDGDVLEQLPLPTDELMKLLVSVTKHLAQRNLSVEVVTLHARKAAKKKEDVSEMRTAFTFFQRRIFGIKWTGYE